MWTSRRAALFLAALIAVAGCRRGGSDWKGTYRISLPYELEQLDPHARNHLSDFSILSNFYEPLVSTDATLSLRPCLAERWENPDLVTWVFHLRRGVRFHDGHPMTAADVVFSIERVLRDRSLEMSGYVPNISGVRALGPGSVEVKTNKPMANLLNKLRFVTIIPAGATPAQLRAGVNGTGPYQLEGRGTVDEITLVRNEAYWGPRPALERVVLRLKRSPDSALADLLGGESEFVQCSSRAGLAAARGRSDIVVRENNSISVKFLIPDVSRETTPWVPGQPNPFRDPRVRHAMSLAIDRRQLAGSLGVPAVPASQLVPPFVFGYDSSLPALAHDPERARQLLAEAGYPNGFAVTLHVRNLLSEAVTSLRTALDRVGIRAAVVLLGDTEFFEGDRNGKFSLILSRFGCPSGDESDILENAIHTPDTAGGFGAINSGNYSSPRIDALIQKSTEALDMAVRRQLLHELTAAVLEDMPVIPLFCDRDVYLLRPGVAWQPRHDNFVIASEIGLAR